MSLAPVNCVRILLQESQAQVDRLPAWARWGGATQTTCSSVWSTVRQSYIGKFVKRATEDLMQHALRQVHEFFWQAGRTAGNLRRYARFITGALPSFVGLKPSYV